MDLKLHFTPLPFLLFQTCQMHDDLHLSKSNETSDKILISINLCLNKIGFFFFFNSIFYRYVHMQQNSALKKSTSILGLNSALQHMLCFWYCYHLSGSKSLTAILSRYSFQVEGNNKKNFFVKFILYVISKCLSRQL